MEDEYIQPDSDQESSAQVDAPSTENREQPTSETITPTTHFDEGGGAALDEDASQRIHTLSGMYRRWFLDYASYVILERAIPHIADGLKPVQRRVLFAMRHFENGHLHKVAKIVGQTMAFHPHGDASINDALVQLGQKGYLIDTQGNWGNILTGDDAAAGRYIEAKLSPLALEVLFDDKLTEWKKSYDGTSQEPVALPARFPLLLAQGAEGIAVGLSSKIYPHNPRELLEAAIAYLEGKEFELYPDFPTGGLLDVDRYNDGKRGGQLKSRALVERTGDRILSIKELPYGKTTASLIDSIIKASEKGQIKIKHIDDMTAATADIRLQLPTGVSADKTIDGLYAFTDCEVSLSPNACVIQDDKPVFLGVSDLLKYSADRTKHLLEEQLRYRLDELKNAHLAASLEQIFIEERIYKDRPFEEATNEREALLHVRQRIEEALGTRRLYADIKEEDIKRLLEIRMARILRFNQEKQEKLIVSLEKEMREIERNLAESTRYTIDYYRGLIEQFGRHWQRRTQLVRLSHVEATKVVEASEKLYFDPEGNFVGTGLKGATYICDISPLDDLIVFYRNGGYQITKVEEKKFLGQEEVIHIDRYKRGDERTIYNVIYRCGKKSPHYIKRFYVSGVTRDRMYDLTTGEKGSRVVYFSANPNGEAETVRITLKPIGRSRKLVFERDFGEMPIRGRSTRGNLVTKAEVQRIVLKERGASTLGGRKVWYDPDVNRLNFDERGRLIGEFEGEDKLLITSHDGQCFTAKPDESLHFPLATARVEKWDPDKVWSVVYREREQGMPYLKRFRIEESEKPEFMQGEGNQLITLSDEYYARFRLSFGGRDSDRPSEEIEADNFIGIKSMKAKGKRLTTREISTIERLAALQPDPEKELPKAPLVANESDMGEDEPESHNEELTPYSLF